MNYKALVEKRNANIDDMSKILDNANLEKRAMTEEEEKTYKAKQEEVKRLDITLRAAEDLAGMEKLPNPNDDSKKDNKKEDKATLEVRAFEDLIRNKYSKEELVTRADFTFNDNGAIIPRTIANRIIDTVKEIAPIFELSTKFTVKGELVFPVYDESKGKVTCAWATEFKALSTSGGQFTSKSLNGYLAGVLTKVSRSLINNSDFDVVSYVIYKIAEAISLFVENELLHGTTDKTEGLLSATQVITADSSAAITTDNLVDVQMKVPSKLQGKACWIMHPNTRKAISKLKDNEGHYLMQRDLTQGFGFTMLGKPVYLSDNMPEIGAGLSPVAYGDMSGLYTKMVADDMAMQVLQEKYAEEHVVGVVGWIYLDSKIVEPQKLAILTMKTA